MPAAKPQMPPASSADSAAKRTVGKRLRKGRLDMQWSLDQVADTLKIRKDYLKAIEADDYKSLPEQIYATGFVRAYAKLVGLEPSQIAQELVHNNEFEKYVKQFKISPEIIAKALIEIPKEISKRFNLSTENINVSSYELIFKAIEDKKINESAILEILTEVAKGNKIDLKKFKKVSTSGIESEIKTMVKANKKLSPNAIMGMVMAKYRGKVDGKKVMEIIKANL